MAKKRRKYTRKKGIGRIIYGPVAFLLILAVLFFGLSVFFKIEDFEVVGNKAYARSEIIEASGIKTGDNLFFVRKATASEKICEALPYIHDVKISKELPNTIILTVTENAPIASVLIGGEYWVIDSSAKVLEKTNLAIADELIQIDGLHPETPVLNNKLAVPDEEKNSLRDLILILQSLMESDVYLGVTYLDVSNISRITFYYGGRFEILLGGANDVEYKMEMLQEVVSQLEENERGRIDLSRSNEASFTRE